MLSIIVAYDKNRVIGRKGELPWRLSADLRRFKRLTMNHAIVMGRKTYESIGRPLPGRRMIAISRAANYHAAHAEVVHSMAEALAATQGDDEVFVVGGGEIYRAALPLADRLYITLVEAETAGDATFPKFDAAQWQLIEQKQHPQDARNIHAFQFLIYQRRAADAGVRASTCIVEGKVNRREKTR